MYKDLAQLMVDFAKLKTKYEVLINYIINNSTLSYNQKSLKLDDISTIIKALEPEKYDSRLDILLYEKTE